MNFYGPLTIVLDFFHFFVTVVIIKASCTLVCTFFETTNLDSRLMLAKNGFSTKL
jgi:hypothetical protein